MEEQEQPAPSSGSLKISLKLAGIRKEADKPGEPAAAAPQEENPNNADQPGSSTDRQMPFYCFSERLPCKF
uniref:Mediator of RNA polymerase II transcription subunit 19 n=1 Tax=Panagrolaimus sp. JU765 TaxID=591449 RepID=A0AC34Q951_9BILA